MVYFTCNNCGESVKKPSVEKHYNTKCRNNPKNVSCMDCQKDFNGEEYVAHNKCISEAEKYSGKNYVAKENKNSGQKKQETWMDIVRSILESTEYDLSAQTRNIFQKLQNYENVPRKKAKFQNFVKSCLRIPEKQARPVWEVLEKELENMKKIKQLELAASKVAIKESNQVKETDVKQQNGLKRKLEEHNAVDEKVEKKKKKKGNKLDVGVVEEKGVTEAIEETDALAACKVSIKESNQVKETDVQQQNGLKCKLGEYNAVNEKVEKKKKGNKSDVEVVEETGVTEAIEETDAFQWSTVLEKLVAKHPEGLPLDKLKKKLIKKYKNKLKLEELSAKQQKKFEKKFSKTLNKCPTLQVEGEIAKPC